MMSSYICLFLFIVLSSRILVSSENCRVGSFKTETHFDMRKFLGLWYQVTSIFDTNNEEIFRDTIYNLKLNDNGSATMHIAYRASGDSQCTTYSNLLSSTKILGNMLQTDNVNDDTMNFWVIKTNYVSYAVIYGCIHEDIDGTCSDARAEVLSRKPSLPDSLQSTVNSVIRSVCVDLKDFRKITQNNKCDFSDYRSSGNMAISAERGMLLVASFVLCLRLIA